MSTHKRTRNRPICAQCHRRIDEKVVRRTAASPGCKYGLPMHQKCPTPSVVVDLPVGNPQHNLKPRMTVNGYRPA